MGNKAGNSQMQAVEDLICQAEDFGLYPVRGEELLKIFKAEQRRNPICVFRGITLSAV